MKEDFIIIIFMLALFLASSLIRRKFNAKPRYNLIISLAGILFFACKGIVKTIRDCKLHDSFVYHLLLTAVVYYLGVKAWENYKQLKAK